MDREVLQNNDSHEVVAPVETHPLPEGVSPHHRETNRLHHHEERGEKENATVDEPSPPAPEPVPEKARHKGSKDVQPDSTNHRCTGDDNVTTEHKDAEALAQEEIVKNTPPTTELEIALTKILERKEALIDRITGEIAKMKNFVKKRKQTYKRKRKEDGAPTRALSAYNMFIKERFEELSKQNEEALKSDDANAKLKRVPPSSLVAKTGNEWKELPEEIKQKYEEKAHADRKRYEEEMAAYQPPDKQANRKRNKTGYNMFFSSHVLRLKQTESGVPSERGSVARLVGNAWKSLSNDEKMYYEREADKHNGMNPVPGGEDEEEEDEPRPPPHMEHQYVYPPPPPVHPQLHMHAAVPPPPPMHPAEADPRHHYYPPPPPPHMYAQNPYGHYDYSQHHQRHPPMQGRQQGYQYAGHRGHLYDM